MFLIALHICKIESQDLFEITSLIFFSNFSCHAYIPGTSFFLVLVENKFLEGTWWVKCKILMELGWKHQSEVVMGPSISHIVWKARNPILGGRAWNIRSFWLPYIIKIQRPVKARPITKEKTCCSDIGPFKKCTKFQKYGSSKVPSSSLIRI